MDYLNIQNRFKRTEEAKASLKLRLNEMKLRLKQRKEKFNLECSSFIQEELAFKHQLNDSGCLSEESSNKQQNLESLKSVQYLQKKFERRLKKKQQQERNKKAKLIKPTNNLDETILSIVDISSFAKFIGSDVCTSGSSHKIDGLTSRTSTPIFNEKSIRRCRPRRFSSSRKASKCCSAALQSPQIMDNKYFNIIENNYYNYSINLNNYEQKAPCCSAITNTPGEFQDFGDFKIWYL
jgi:hypothetical protein